MTKVPYIENLLYSEGLLAFALTETWLTDDHNDAECHIPGYTLYCQDRKRPRSGKGRNSGGVALYHEDRYIPSTEQIFNYSGGVIEAVGIYVATLNVVYRQPDYAAHGNCSTSGEFKSLVGKLRASLMTFLNQSSVL